MDNSRFYKELMAEFPSGKLMEVTHEFEDAGVREGLDFCPDVPGLTSVKKQIMLNLAVSCLGPGECYLEVGTYAGKTLISALFGHAGCPAYACDNFSEFEDSNSLGMLMRNLGAYGLKDRVVFFDADFRDVLKAENIPYPVGVYFYDGAHDEQSQFDGIKVAEPLLADEALVVVDDWRYAPDSLSGAKAGTTRAIEESENEWHLLMDLPARYNGDHAMWWNGVAVFGFKSRRPG